MLRGVGVSSCCHLQRRRSIIHKGFASQPESTEHAQQQQKAGGSWARITALFRDHGAAFAIVYGTAYAATWLPLFASLEMGGVDGPELLAHAIEYVGLGDSVDMSWITNNRYLNREVINAFIAMEVNGVLEICRLPIVIGVVPYVSAKLKTTKKPTSNVTADAPPQSRESS